MPVDTAFSDLLRRVRAGDAEAARQLVLTYEPAIRRAVHFRVADPRLRSVVDSMDICQSVLGSFLIRAAHGEYELNNPEDLQKLLVTIARNKLVGWVRRESSQGRDRGRVGSLPPDDRHPADTDARPDDRVADAELVAEARRRFTAEERELAELRDRGMEWDEIAEQLATPAATLRKRMSRALERVARELGVEDDAE